MRTSVFNSALMALLCFSATGCSTTSSWMSSMAFWRKDESISKETALAQTAPKLPSQVATGQPNGLSAPMVSYPGAAVAAQTAPQYGAQPVSATAPTGQAGYPTTQAGPYNPAAYGQTNPVTPTAAYPSSAGPYGAATSPYSGATTPAATGAYPSTAPGQSGGAAYPAATYPQNATSPAAGQPYSAAAPAVGGRYAAAGAPVASAVPADGGYTLQPAQPVAASQPMPAHPLTTADARNTYPGSAPATSQTVEQPSGFRPGGTSDYQPIQPATSAVPAADSSNQVVPAGGTAVEPAAAYPVHPASAQSVVGGRYSVYQAGGQVPQEPHRFQR